MYDIENKPNTIQGIYTSKMERDLGRHKKKVADVLNSRYHTQFQHELQTFFEQINLFEDEIPSETVCADMLANIQSGKDRSIDGILRLLSSRLKKINSSSISEDEKIDIFIEKIIGKENIRVLDEFIKSNQKDTLKSTKEWYNFLNNADKKLVFPIIVGGMGSMGFFKFLTQGGIEHLKNSGDVLKIPGMDNMVQGLITIGVLLIIKKLLKLKIQKNI